MNIFEKLILKVDKDLRNLEHKEWLEEIDEMYDAAIKACPNDYLKYWFLDDFKKVKLTKKETKRLKWLKKWGSFRKKIINKADLIRKKNKK